jgi:hypothetical protein
VSSVVAEPVSPPSPHRSSFRITQKQSKDEAYKQYTPFRISHVDVIINLTLTANLCVASNIPGGWDLAGMVVPRTATILHPGQMDHHRLHSPYSSVEPIQKNPM